MRLEVYKDCHISPNKVTQQPYLVSCRVHAAQEKSGLELLILTLILYFQSYSTAGVKQPRPLHLWEVGENG